MQIAEENIPIVKEVLTDRSKEVETIQSKPRKVKEQQIRESCLLNTWSSACNEVVLSRIETVQQR